MQRGRTSLADIVILLMVAFVLYYAYVYLPHYYNKYVMDELAIETLDVWRDTDSQREARLYLLDEIEEREIAFYIHPRTCELKQSGRQRHITCSWQAIVHDPLRNKESFLPFSLHKYLNPEGLLEDVE